MAHYRTMTTSSNEPDRTIVVGADGSAASERALRWAALEAVRTSATLRIVNVWSVPAMAWPATIGAVYLDPGDIEEGARRIVERAQSSVRRAVGQDALVSDTSTMQGGPAECLMVAARGASLLVLGNRGRGGFASLVLGSVAATCAHHSTVPVAVVGVDAPAPGTGEVVVGVDDSIGGRGALRWAVGEAARVGVGVRAVHGWELPIAGLDGAPTLGPLEDPDLAEAARSGFERFVADETADLAERPPISVVTLPLSAPEALIQEAKGAALLVVGSRGRAGFVGLLMGSVSQHCLHHSPCPLVIVPTAPAPTGT